MGFAPVLSMPVGVAARRSALLSDPLPSCSEASAGGGLSIKQATTAARHAGTAHKRAGQDDDLMAKVRIVAAAPECLPDIKTLGRSEATAIIGETMRKRSFSTGPS
jgi:hypothetical protein